MPKAASTFGRQRQTPQKALQSQTSGPVTLGSAHSRPRRESSRARHPRSLAALCPGAPGSPPWKEGGEGEEREGRWHLNRPSMAAEVARPPGAAHLCTPVLLEVNQGENQSFWSWRDQSCPPAEGSKPCLSFCYHILIILQSFSNCNRLKNYLGNLVPITRQSDSAGVGHEFAFLTGSELRPLVVRIAQAHDFIIAQLQ